MEILVAKEETAGSSEKSEPLLPRRLACELLVEDLEELASELRVARGIERSSGADEVVEIERWLGELRKPLVFDRVDVAALDQSSGGS